MSAWVWAAIAAIAILPCGALALLVAGAQMGSTRTRREEDLAGDALRDADAAAQEGSSGMTATAPPEFVVTTDGERRQVTRMWPDGSWECPFCGGANVPGTCSYDHKDWEAPCGNPACPVGGACTAEATARMRERDAREAASKAHEAALAEAQKRAAAEREERRDKAIAAFKVEALERGWCPRCWGKSTSYGLWLDREIKVRHRSADNCPEERRDEQRRSRS